MNYRLPSSLEVCGREYEIRTDYRAVLDVLEVLSDVNLTNPEKAECLLTIIYKDVNKIPNNALEEAIKQAFWFINGGEENDGSGKKSPRLLDWGQDFKLIVAPINKSLGFDVRAVEHLHWWTFLSEFQEMGDCLFAQVVAIRSKLARHKPLSKAEREWYRQNRKIVDIRTEYTDAEKELISAWTTFRKN